MKDIPKRITVVAELGDKGSQQAMDMALGGVLEVKVMIRDQGRSLFKIFLISSMIAELIADMSFLSNKQTRTHEPKDAFPSTS